MASGRVVKKVRLDASRESKLAVEAQQFCGANGLVMVSPKHEDGSLVHAPVSLLPYSFPQASFELAQELAVPFNRLVDVCSRDDDFLQTTLVETVRGDEFTRQLLDLYNRFGGKRSTQKLQLGLHRSDYMLDAATHRLLQIELNTIASSFGCLSARVTRLHQHLVGYKSYLIDEDQAEKQFTLPDNAADEQLPAAIAQAHRAYELQNPTVVGAVVLFVCQEGERNYVDQRHLEYELANKHGVTTIRLTLAEVFAQTTLLPKSQALLLHGKHVAVVYFRAGYTPNDYRSEVEWDARARLEQSLAIKCPSIGYHLVGAKKIQQELARPGVLERFVHDPNEVKLLRSCFAGLWSLNEPNEAVREMVFANPGKFVVKPQREGGGNNLYGQEVKSALLSMPQHELAAHILMERIFPPSQTAWLMRNGHVVQGQAVCELGVYSTFLGNGTEVLINCAAGHLLRTKFEGVDEGGVATGFSALSSPWLV
ncbi:glutathione synthetase [Batrachochytrium salamandrivorans]|nr:glutathione synthetase [Batrachochytrium salamandrivorans]